MGPLLDLSCFISLFKKKKEEEEAEAKIAKCQHWSNLYGIYTEDLLLAVLLCMFEIFQAFLKGGIVAVIFKSTAGRGPRKRGLQECSNRGWWCGPGGQGWAGTGGGGI